MEAGDHLRLPDVAGREPYRWTSRGFRFRTDYDGLHRPGRSWVSGGDLARELLFEQADYGEQQPEAERLNLRTRPYRTRDAAGVVIREAYDFKGNLLRSSRQLARQYQQPVDWSAAVPLDEPVYRSYTAYDALDRPVQLTAPDDSIVRPSSTRPRC